ncbi:MAG: hypothetical protein E7Z89_07590 [Cyanobacteria bacterium SIG28]|nr:hypothetical protein [Cyanobacteria bacterium SIG28]
MKKFAFTILLVFLFSIPTAFADSWDDFTNIDRAWDGQKTITNQEFEEVIDKLEENKEKKDDKKFNKLLKKISGGGNSLHPEMNVKNEIQELKLSESFDKEVLLNTPVDLYISGKILEKGFYKVLGEKNKDNKIEISFYQSQFLKGKIEATETSDDFGEQEINFAKIVEYNDSYVKIIYGSIDFNAFAFIPLVK